MAGLAFSYPTLNPAAGLVLGLAALGATTIARGAPGRLAAMPRSPALPGSGDRSGRSRVIRA